MDTDPRATGEREQDLVREIEEAAGRRPAAAPPPAAEDEPAPPAPDPE